jgi:hypothetical protein
MKPKVAIGGIKSTSCVFFKVDHKSAVGPIFGTEINKMFFIFFLLFITLIISRMEEPKGT